MLSWYLIVSENLNEVILLFRETCQRSIRRVQNGTLARAVMRFALFVAVSGFHKELSASDWMAQLLPGVLLRCSCMGNRWVLSFHPLRLLSNLYQTVFSSRYLPRLDCIFGDSNCQVPCWAYAEAERSELVKAT